MRIHLRSLCALIITSWLCGAGLVAAEDTSLPQAILGNDRKVEGAFQLLGGGLLSGLGHADSDSTDDDEPAPAELLYIHVSRDFLAQSLRKSIERETQLDDTILDTRITGTSHTSGASDIIFQDSANRAVAEIHFQGTVHSRTVGRNGPAILHNVASTPFQARKQFVIDAQGLHVMPAVVSAQTCSTTTDIQSTSPGLRGRVTQRVAWRRVEEMRAEADAIAARHAEERLAKEFNEYADAKLEKVRKKLLTSVPSMPLGADSGSIQLAFSSTPSHIHITARSGAASANSLTAPAIEGNPKVAVQVHKSVVKRLMNDPTIRQSVTALIGQLMANPLEGGSAQLTSTKPKYKMHWSADHTWMVLEYDPPAVPAAAEPAIAADMHLQPMGK